MTPRNSAGPPVVGESQDLVERITDTPGLLIGFDYDGTLTPIAEEPDEPTISRSLVQALEELASRDDVQIAVVSGRQLDDLLERVSVGDVICAGNHGLELARDGERTVQDEAERKQSTVQSLSSELGSRIGEISGCTIENKGVTISVHVRQASQEASERIRKVVDEVTANQSDVYVTEGKQVFEVRPSVAQNKGTTMAMLRDDTPNDWVTMFIGDDTTDEDAFEAIQPDGIGIHVGTNTETSARYRISSQERVTEFVRWIHSALTSQ
jgi:trehalose 6-phosphate phosphatase